MKSFLVTRNALLHPGKKAIHLIDQKIGKMFLSSLHYLAINCSRLADSNDGARRWGEWYVCPSLNFKTCHLAYSGEEGKKSCPCGYNFSILFVLIAILVSADLYFSCRHFIGFMSLFQSHVTCQNFSRTEAHKKSL